MSHDRGKSKNYYPKNWQLEASTNGINWFTVTSEANIKDWQYEETRHFWGSSTTGKKLFKGSISCIFLNKILHINITYLHIEKFCHFLLNLLFFTAAAGTTCPMKRRVLVVVVP